MAPNAPLAAAVRCRNGGGRATLHEHLSLLAPRPSLFADVPPAWDEPVLGCLAKEPERRPNGVAELRRRLEELAVGERFERRSPTSIGAPKSLASEAQMAAILVLDGVESVLEAAAVIERLQGFVARAEPNRLVCVFSAVDCREPLDAALCAGTAAGTHGLATAIAIDVSSVVVARASDRARSAHGRALDHVDSWLMGSRARVFLTETASRGVERSRIGELEQSFQRSSVVRGIPNPNELPNDVPLFGRDKSLDLVRGTLERWRASGGAAVTLVLGAPGVGKTRLAAEIVRLAPLLPEARFLALRPDRSTNAYDALLEALARLAFTLPGEMAVSADTGGSGANARRFRDALAESARQAPLVLVVDDAEWMNEEVLDAIEHVLLTRSSLPICVVAIAEPRFARTHAPWCRRVEAFVTLELEPLSRRAGLELCRRLLHPAEYVPEEALSRICEAGAYLPKLLVDIVSEIHRAGLIRERHDGRSCYFDTAELESVPGARLGSGSQCVNSRRSSPPSRRAPSWSRPSGSPSIAP